MAVLRTMSPTMSTSSPSTLSFYLFIAIMFLSFSNIVTSQNQTDIGEMLLELKVDFENTGALDSSWIKGTNPCDQKKKWVGVSCRKDMVRVLHLSGYNLSGEFNVDAISDLKSIRTINIAKNHFSGPIPEFNLLDGLRDLVANGNKFDGEIVSTFFATNQRSRLRTIHLSSNNFSGKIPESLASSAPNLKELLLDDNEFSGPVPLFPQQTLKIFNVSFNKLEGEIPKDMVAKFGAEAFAENPGLCSPNIGKECQSTKVANSSSHGSSSSIKWIILGVIIAILGVTLLLLRQTTKKNDLPPLEPGNIEHGGMHMKEMSRSKNSSVNTSGGGAPVSNSAESNPPRKGSHSSKEGGELIIVNDERGTFGLSDLMKAAAEVLGNGTLGSAYKAVMENGVSVVVKRLKDMNKMHRDKFYMEMRHLGGLRHKNILPPLAYLYKKEEKLIVSEYVARGSLLYLLHGNRGIAHFDLTWSIRLKIIKGVSQGLGFLHSEFPTYELPHGNLKSSNILLSADFEPLLSDYAFHPMFNSTQAGTMFAYSAPEAIMNQQVSPKSDVFCLGIIILEVLTGKFPIQYLNNKEGGTDVVLWARSVVSEKKETEFFDPEIASTNSKESSVEEMVKLLHIGVDCTNNEHDTRIDMKEAISRIGDLQV